MLAHSGHGAHEGTSLVHWLVDHAGLLGLLGLVALVCVCVVAGHTILRGRRSDR